MTIGYVTIGADDVEAAAPFYDAVLGAIGYERAPMDQAPPGWAFWGVKGGAPTVGLCRPYDGGAARAGNGIMLAFMAEPAQIRAAHAAALANGGRDEGAPGFRPPEATSDFYAAYVRDAVGNKLCFFNMS